MHTFFLTILQQWTQNIHTYIYFTFCYVCVLSRVNASFLPLIICLVLMRPMTDSNKLLKTCRQILHHNRSYPRVCNPRRRRRRLLRQNCPHTKWRSILAHPLPQHLENQNPDDLRFCSALRSRKSFTIQIKLQILFRTLRVCVCVHVLLLLLSPLLLRREHQQPQHKLNQPQKLACDVSPHLSGKYQVEDDVLYLCFILSQHLTRKSKLLSQKQNPFVLFCSYI